jgi:hypothetical protein
MRDAREARCPEPVSREERRERIRTAIFREGRQQARWRDTNLTYAAAYQQAYCQPLEARHDDPQGWPLRLSGRLLLPTILMRMPTV